MNKWIEKAKRDLNLIISNQCRESFLQANTKKDGTLYQKRRPYSVPEESQKALRYVEILTYNDTVTRGQEEEIKAFLMSFRTFRNFI